MQPEHETKQICAECVGDHYLKQEVNRWAVEGTCSYCDENAPVIPIDGLVSRFERAFEDHFYRTPTEPSPLEWTLQKETDYYWERKGNPVLDILQCVAGIEEDVAEHIREILNDRHSDNERYEMGEECEFDSSSYYEDRRVDPAEWQSTWRRFQYLLRDESRFFNREARDILDDVLADIHTYRTMAGEKIVIRAGPGAPISGLFRARVFQNDEKLEVAIARPDREIGSPPAATAAAGRMNARGISVFYGALSQEVAIAEVRPFVGSKVVTGLFQIIRELHLLNLEALRSLSVMGSVFDESYIGLKRKAKFLKEFSEVITAPVMPDDEAFSYLPTQALADFLAAEIKPPIDGILYPSVQGTAGGQNVVLFHKAALVESLELPEGTDVSPRLYLATSDGDDIDYTVWETVPTNVPPSASDNDYVSLDFASGRCEDRAPALRLNMESVQVSHITGVQFKVDAFPVRRHRVQQRTYPF